MNRDYLWTDFRKPKTAFIPDLWSNEHYVRFPLMSLEVTDTGIFHYFLRANFPFLFLAVTRSKIKKENCTGIEVRNICGVLQEKGFLNTFNVKFQVHCVPEIRR